nr:hypothetical protein [Agromyces marinus]
MRTAVGLLASSPWRGRADRIRSGAMRPSAIDPVGRWMEQYRGGWQTLCPNAGPPRLVGGASVGFHGEASVAAWDVTDHSATSMTLRLEMFSVPVVIERTLTLDGTSLRQDDTLTNLSDLPLELDYSSHPAFGGAFLDGSCTIETGARTFTVDPESSGGRVVTSAWPHVDADGARLDLRALPEPDQRRALFGWLSDFEAGWYSITNHDRRLGVRLEWDASILPQAWWWQELNGTEHFPWFGRARMMAIEPASTTTSGPGRGETLRIASRASVTVPVELRVEPSRS